ncbi:HHL295Wp [Eremothecium sinecaudum]|uniref:Pyrroline-5-carboxylate reductase n=1 Tax=Eremothecium sinecaudum TaxID=45286 RepID=A0A0X8HW33_9SACH|nr:HHL295Wp [Eremothecium sinecaudum]AMD22475.1 HHL295Wp [Eremothecium sinecaudum]
MGYTLTIIGCGVMGQAVLSAIYNAPLANSDTKHFYPQKIITCNSSKASADEVTKLISSFPKSPNGIEVECTYNFNSVAVKGSNVIILGTKPYLVQDVLSDLKGVIEGKLIISLAAGWRIEQLAAFSPKISRVMTNTPAKFGFGTAVIAHSTAVPEAEKLLVSQLISHIGTCIELPEKNMDAATALVGSGPAFVLLMLESLMESGIRLGIPLKQSRECAIKVLEGTAKMAEITGLHPAMLKHQVCTPGGTTIAGLCVMEDEGVRSGIVKGVQEAAKVAASLSGKK